MRVVKRKSYTMDDQYIKAAETGNLDVIKRFFTPGRVKLLDSNKRNVLMIASVNGHLDIVKYLVSKKVDIYLRDNGGRNAFMLSVLHDQKAVVEYFIQAGVDAKLKDDYGRNVLMLAAIKNLKDIVEYLIQAGAKASCKDGYERNVLMLAAKDGCEEVVKYLLSTNTVDISCVDKQGRNALMLAGMNDFVSVVELLLVHGADASVRDNMGRNVLLIAANKGCKHVVEFLIDQEWDLTCTDNSKKNALTLASEKGHDNIVRILLEAGIDTEQPDQHGNTSLIHASKEGHVSVVELLCFHECNVNHQSKTCWTALHYAAAGNHAHMAKALLDAGASMKIETTKGLTPSKVALNKGHADVIRVFNDTRVSKARNQNPLKPEEDEDTEQTSVMGDKTDEQVIKICLRGNSTPSTPSAQSLPGEEAATPFALSLSGSGEICLQGEAETKCRVVAENIKQEADSRLVPSLETTNNKVQVQVFHNVTNNISRCGNVALGESQIINKCPHGDDEADSIDYEENDSSCEENGDL